MKKIFRNNRLIAVAFLTVFSAGATLANDSSRIGQAVPAELKFAGMVNNDPLFVLNISGTQGNDDFVITISDDQGNTLYKENIRTESCTKKFLLNSEELGDAMLRFEISSRKTKTKVLYEVSSKNRYTQETIVRLVQ
ncbi:MAG TPA: hypothetical protein VMZ03_02820 [Chitinophagaceae bacterium]|nr:hypothetical protein [Chitinophagaceae bacterium]